MSKTMLVAALAMVGLPTAGLAETVDELVARNVAARGGAQAWRAVSSLRLTGRMDVGQGMLVPYVLEQKRPRRMRLEIVFEGQTAVQCTDGERGWKLTPFRGRGEVEPLSDEELREAAGPADLDGLLFDYALKGTRVELLGRETVQGRDAFKLQVELSGGAVRRVYLDAESALEIKVEATKVVGTRDHKVETFYHDWQPVEGLLMPHRYETVMEGAEPHLLLVESVRVNPPLDDSRFVKPSAAAARSHEPDERQRRAL